MTMNKIQKLLFDNADEKYRDFHSSLIPDVDKAKIIGVRVPVVKKLAKELKKTNPQIADEFLSELPHEYYDENMLHANLLCDVKDFDKAIEYTETFLPYIDNWAVCDTFNPKVFAKHKSELWQKIDEWLRSSHVYTQRFAIVMAMRYFLDEDFAEDKFERIVSVKSDEYYVNMAIAWYMSVALVKQYDVAIKVLQSGELKDGVHNKSIQKAIESFRISDDKKAYLKTLKKHE